jgi:cellulose synthase/poly-beta-1,6-N-acetylglucosamine synthase-like glycosyltransferase
VELIILVIYGLALAFIFCYSLIQINLTLVYLRKGKTESETDTSLFLNLNEPAETLPFVTIQLPVYNERYVVERLIKSVCALNYPQERFEIQVLDDSTDDTVELINAMLPECRKQGVTIHHIRRSDRTGFKAGALAAGLTQAKGGFIAIFDADFIPHPDFLIRTIPHFQDERIGMVQTRWDHLNKDYSLLTRLQAFGLDAHFSIEQSGRNKAGHFINFNGTAGVWRKRTIEEAGGWQADTLTEDLDLSYRAQLKGWRFLFLENCGSPAELPAAMNALKTQQFRWTKGAAECSRKNLSKVLQSGHFSLSTKLHAVFHLLNSSVFICIVITSLLSLPLLFIKQQFPEYRLVYQLAGIFLLGVLFLCIFYFVSFSKNYTNKWKAVLPFLMRFPLFLSVSMGLSLHNGIAAFEGLIGKKTPFVRTPKFNIRSHSDRWQGNTYLVKRLSWLNFIELALTVYFFIAVVVGIRLEDYGLLPFHLMLFFGFGYVSTATLLHHFSKQPA